MPSFPFNPFNRPAPPPALAPNGKTTELPDDIFALDGKLAGLHGKTLAMSSGGAAWMRPRVIPLVPNGRKPTVYLSVECTLVSHGRHGNTLELVLEGECGTRGTLKLTFPPQGWKLHLVEANAPAPTAPNPTVKPSGDKPKEKPEPPAELANGEEAAPEEEDSVRKKRDDVFRNIFS